MDLQLNRPALAALQQDQVEPGVGRHGHQLGQDLAQGDLAVAGVLQKWKKKWFYCIFYQVNNLFLHQSYLKSPLPAKLTW